MHFAVSWEIYILRLLRNFWEHLSSSLHLRGHCRRLCSCTFPCQSPLPAPGPGRFVPFSSLQFWVDSALTGKAIGKSHSSPNKFITEDVSGGHRPKLFAKNLKSLQARQTEGYFLRTGRKQLDFVVPSPSHKL